MIMVTFLHEQMISSYQLFFKASRLQSALRILF